MPNANTESNIISNTGFFFFIILSLVTCHMSLSSFRSQSCHGADFGGAPRGQPGCEQCSGHQNHAGDCESERISRVDLDEIRAHNFSSSECAEKTDDNPGCAL